LPTTHGTARVRYMSGNDERLRDLIAQQAADWLVANRAELSAPERENFVTWLKASPMHVEEYLGLATIARDLREACADPELSVDSLVASARAAEDAKTRTLWPRILETSRDALSPRWYKASAAVVVIGVLSLGLLAWWNSRPAPGVLAPDTVATLRFETRHGEQQTRRLPDDSVLHLNTDSAVSITYSNSERIVMLTSGEADFEVAHELKRPFRVFAGAAEAVDIGTQFDVRLEHGSTVVTVLDGRVAVGPSSMLHEGTNSSHAPLARFVELAANQQIRIAQGAWPATPIAVDAHRTASWLRRQISFDHEPLARVATEFNRYNSKPIEIDSPELQNLEISGVFATDDIDAFVAFLRSLDGVHVEVTATRIRVTRD
jgi:transmembrane sensor